MKRNALFYFLTFLTITMIVSACKKDDNPVLPPVIPSVAGSYVGTLAGPAETGSLSITIAASKRSSIIDVSITGTLKVVGDTAVTLTGVYKSATDSIYLSGGGYSFAGKLSSGSVTGDFNGPHGPGAFSLKQSTGGTAKVYVGSSTSQAGHGGATLNIVIDGSSLVGLAVDQDNKTYLTGTVIADSIRVGVVGVPDVVVATGRLNGTVASGTYATTNDHGVWSCSLLE